MRKSLILALLITAIVLAASPVFARGGANGMRFGFEIGNPSGVGILRLSALDLRVGYDFTGYANSGVGNFLFLAVDYRVVNDYPITGPLNFFLCFGAFGEIMTETGNNGQNIFGLRLPIGVNLLLFDNAVELFAEIVPTMGVFPNFPSWGAGGIQGWVGFTFALPS